MALIENLVAQISDSDLRDAIAREIRDLKKRNTWGLVFERHLPESTRLLAAPIKVGSVVWERRAAKPKRYRVRAVEADELVLVVEPPNTTAQPDAAATRLPRADVLVEKDFTEPVFPFLTSLGSVRGGPLDRPTHAVIEGENYHAIEALLPAYEEQVDVLYLDPPYNTGAKDWAYNNDYVDPNDAWRSSKWLAFMERRLRLGRRLLKPDGVMVVTIDENEVHHLGMLLDQTFSDARIQMVTIVNNPKGVAQDTFARVEEYAYFVFFGGSRITSRIDDLLTPEPEGDAVEGQPPRWYNLLRSGTNASRADRQRMFYPVLIDPERQAVVGTGRPLPFDEEPDLDAKVDGFVAVWPIRSDGSYGRWSFGNSALNQLINIGYVSLGSEDPKRRTWSMGYLGKKHQAQLAAGVLEIVGFDEKRQVVDVRFVGHGTKVVKTVWHRTRHDAGVGGTAVLTSLLGKARVFPFAKSLYAVRDTLDILTHDRPDALIMDFFAGSGTTLHATLLLNAQDTGRRRCVLATNNEVRADVAARLNRHGHFRGDPEFEAAGVFESATRPRVTTAITGVRPDGAKAVGTYLDLGREYADGLPENVEFFRLDYLDPIAIDLGLHFRELHPLLWLTAGGIGEREDIDPASRFALPAGSPYGVLFNPSGMQGLLAGLSSRPDVTHVFIAADSEASFADLATAIPAHVQPIQLYRNYLETLRGARA